jgi:hypothetical protein
MSRTTLLQVVKLCRFSIVAINTYGQTLDTQLEQLRAAGCSSQNSTAIT